MADLKNQIIATSYHKLLQVSASGELADGKGDNVTLNVNGSDTYLSESVNLTKAITVTGSIVPEGVDMWDLGSPTNPFRDLWLSEESLKFVKTEVDEKTGVKTLSVSKLSKTAVDSLLRGEIVQRIDDSGRELAVAKAGYSTSQRIISGDNTNTYIDFGVNNVTIVVDNEALLDLNKKTGITTIGGQLQGQISTDAVELDDQGDVMFKDVSYLNNEFWEISSSNELWRAIGAPHPGYPSGGYPRPPIEAVPTGDTEINFVLKPRFFSLNDDAESDGATNVYFG